MATTSELVTQLIVAIGGTGVLASAANGFFSRRKTRGEIDHARADAAKVLADSAAILVEPLRQQLARVDRQVKVLQDREEAVLRLLRIHAEWDMQVALQLRDAGIHVDPPPPLHVAHNRRR